MPDPQSGWPPESGMESLKYDVSPNVEDPRSSHYHLVEMTGFNRTVLEIGPATGYITRVLRDRGCSVTCIEIDPEMAAKANQYCSRMIVGDIETLDLSQSLGAAKYDVVLLGDVLEHLKDPWKVLNRLKPFLRPDGYTVVSLPNIAHGSVRLALLYGDFRYQPLGLLDQGHLRFFTFNTALELFHQAGYAVRKTVRLPRALFDTELPLHPKRIARPILQAVEQDSESLTYQFLFKAYPRRDKEFPVTIVLPVFNQVEQTIACLEAVAKNTLDEQYELIVVDNASTDGTADFLSMLEGDVQIVTNPANVGYARSCNLGAHLTGSRYLLFLRSEAVLRAGWLQSQLQVAEKLQDLGLMGGTRISGLLVPRAAFWAVGGFDEDHRGDEDLHLSLRMRQQGYRILPAPVQAP